MLWCDSGGLCVKGGTDFYGLAMRCDEDIDQTLRISLNADIAMDTRHFETLVR